MKSPILRETTKSRPALLAAALVLGLAGLSVLNQDFASLGPGPADPRGQTAALRSLAAREEVGRPGREEEEEYTEVTRDLLAREAARRGTRQGAETKPVGAAPHPQPDRAKAPTPAEKNENTNDQVMHTFYAMIDSTQQKAPSDDEVKAQAMLRVWRDSWEAKGWKVKVLTLEDAKRHPKYEEINAKLDHIPLEGYGGTGYYNRLCYLRYLAIAALGGGWMSDYDVVALAPPPSSSEMTELQTSGNGFTVFGENGVPSMMYGTQSGWDRIASGIVESGLRHNGEDVKLWSDMFALMELGKESKPPQYDLRDDILSGKEVLLGRDLTVEECETVVKGKRAVHFNHGSVAWAKKEGRLQDHFKGVEDRDLVIRAWFRMYRAMCEGRISPNWELEAPELLARMKLKEDEASTKKE